MSSFNRLARTLSRSTLPLRSAVNTLPSSSSSPSSRFFHSTRHASQDIRSNEYPESGPTTATPGDVNQHTDNTVKVEGINNPSQQSSSTQSPQQSSSNFSNPPNYRGSPISDTAETGSDGLGDNLSPGKHQGKHEQHANQSSLQTHQGQQHQRGGLRRHNREYNDALDIFSDPFRMFDRMSESLLKPLISSSPFHSAFFNRPSTLFNDDMNASLMSPMKSLMNWESELSKVVQTTLEEKEKEFLLHVRAPNFKKDDLSLRLDGDLLIISGRTSSEHKGKKGRNYSSESSTFTRQIRLPDSIDVKQLNAKYENGELRIHLPKTAQALQSTQDIKIH